MQTLFPTCYTPSVPWLPYGTIHLVTQSKNLGLIFHFFILYTTPTSSASSICFILVYPEFSVSMPSASTFLISCLNCCTWDPCFNWPLPVFSQFTVKEISYKILSQTISLPAHSLSRLPITCRTRHKVLTKAFRSHIDCLLPPISIPMS